MIVRIKKNIKYIALLLLFALCFTQSNAVFKERDFGKTIDVLCAELEQKYKEQKETMQRYNQNAKRQHEQLVAMMQQIDQISLILYSQSSEFTFDMAYACQQATDLYQNSKVTHMPFQKIMARLDAEEERYDSLIYVLKHIAPAITDEVISTDGKKGKKVVLKVDTTERTDIELVADSIMTTHRATHANGDIDREMGATPQGGNIVPQPTTSGHEALYVLNDREKKIRELCLIYATALRNNIIRVKNQMSADKEYYDQVTNKLTSLNNYALKKYEELQNSIFRNGGSNYFAVLSQFGHNFQRISSEIKDKYSELHRAGERTNVKSQWRGPIIVMTSVFILFYIFISTLLSVIILRWLLPKRIRNKPSYQGKKGVIGLTCGVFLFTVFISNANYLMHHNFLVMATRITLDYSWLLLVILLSLLIRLDGRQIKAGVMVYTPFMLMAFVVIVFRIIFIPNNVVNLIYPPILLLFTLWQMWVLRKRTVKLPVSDVVFSIISLAAMIVACVLAWVGYTLLAVQIMVWWSFQLACIQTIICLYDLAVMYRSRVLLTRVSKSALAMSAVTTRNKKKKVNTEKLNAKLLEQIKKGDYIGKSWFYDIFVRVVLPVLAVLSVLLSIVFAAKMFDMKHLLIKIFFYNFIDEAGLLQISLYKIVLVCALFFVFYYINYLIHSIYRKIKLNHYAKSGDTRRPNITLANNIITILVWGSYFIFALVLFKVPKSGISLISAGLATGLGFAMKDILENFIYGLSLMSGRLRVGDYIECDGILGKVESIGYQSTQIVTLDGSIIAFLNTQLFNKNFKNMTKNHSYEYVKLPVGVAYGSNIDHVREKLVENLNKLCDVTNASGRPIVQKKTGFKVFFDDFGDNSVDLRVAFWVLVEEKIAFVPEVKEAIYNTLQRYDIEIPFPQRDIYIRKIATPQQQPAKAQRKQQQPPAKKKNVNENNNNENNNEKNNKPS